MVSRLEREVAGLIGRFEGLDGLPILHQNVAKVVQILLMMPFELRIRRFSVDRFQHHPKMRQVMTTQNHLRGNVGTGSSSWESNSTIVMGSKMAISSSSSVVRPSGS